MLFRFCFCFFFFNDTATTEIYTLSLHDALPISPGGCRGRPPRRPCRVGPPGPSGGTPAGSCDHDWRRPEVDDPASGCRTTRLGHARLALARGSGGRRRATAASTAGCGLVATTWCALPLVATLVAAAPPAVSTVASHGQRQVAIGARGGHRWLGWPRAARPAAGRPPPCSRRAHLTLRSTPAARWRPPRTAWPPVSGWLACTPHGQTRRHRDHRDVGHAS